MATKKQLLAKIKKLQSQLNGTTKNSGDLLETAKNFVNTKYKKGSCVVQSVRDGTYTRKDGNVINTKVLKVSDNSEWIVGKNRFWKVK